MAWLSLDEGDNDTARFLTYLIAALGALKRGFGAVTLGLLQTPQPPPPQAILTSLINELSEIAGPFALVLDDCHAITGRPIHEALAFLLDHLPSQMRLVMLTRADPPLPLARLRARDQLTEIRAADLRFTVAESAAFLNRMMGLALTPEQIAALEQRTEGWIAGLQLPALSAQGRSDLHDFVAAFAGSHRYIVDYLAEEVLGQQPEAAGIAITHCSRTCSAAGCARSSRSASLSCIAAPASGTSKTVSWTRRSSTPWRCRTGHAQSR